MNPTLRPHELGGPPPTPRKKRRREEHREQERFVSWARLRGLWIMHCPNELVGQVSRGRAAELKRLGVSAGVPDILIFGDADDVAIEFKGPRGSVSRAQRGWLERFERIGWHVAVVKTCEEAVKICAEVGL